VALKIKGAALFEIHAYALDWVHFSGWPQCEKSGKA